LWHRRCVLHIGQFKCHRNFTKENEMNNETKPSVSVIIPTYNCLEYLPLAIQSVLDQDVENIEIIVIDDGSTDGTFQWLKDLAKKDKRIIPLTLDRKGVSTARNFALCKAKSKLVAFLDADDIWLPGKLRKQLEFHEHNPDIVMSFTNYEHFSPDNNSLGTCFDYWPRFKKFCKNKTGFIRLNKRGPGLIFSENVVGTSSVVASRNALQNAKGFDTSLNSASDWDLWLSLSLSGPIGFNNSIMMNYLVRPNSISSNALLRLSALNTIVDRYQHQIRQLDKASINYVKGRLSCAYAEYYQSQRYQVKALKNHCSAFLFTPSIRLARAAATNLKNIMGLSSY